MATCDVVTFLSHPMRAAPEANAARLAAIAAGAATLWPGRTFRRLLDPWTDVGRAAARRRLLIGGDPRPAAWPAGPMGPAWHDASATPPAGIVWICGPRDADVASDEAHARTLGVPVAVMDAQAQTEMIAAGRAAAGRALRESAGSASAGALAGLMADRREFRGARAVIRAWFLSATWRLGGGSPGMEPRAGRGGAETFAGRAEAVVLRTTRAVAIIHEARLTRQELDAVRMREIDGLTLRRTALALGMPDDGSAEDRAMRIARRAMRKIDVVLRTQEGR